MWIFYAAAVLPSSVPQSRADALVRSLAADRFEAKIHLTSP
jgi:hypothetical protein